MSESVQEQPLKQHSDVVLSGLARTIEATQNRMHRTGQMRPVKACAFRKIWCHNINESFKSAPTEMLTVGQRYIEDNYWLDGRQMIYQTENFTQVVQKRLEHLASQVISQNLDWATRDAQKYCESEIEKLFLLAWVEKLEEYRMQGWFRGWVSKYYILGKDERPSLPPCQQINRFIGLLKKVAIKLIYPQQIIGNYRADFVLTRLRFNYPQIDDDNYTRVCDQIAKVVVECDGRDFLKSKPNAIKQETVSYKLKAYTC